MANSNTPLTEAERKQRMRESQKRYSDRKAAEKRASIGGLNEIPVSKIEENPTTSSTTPINVLFENLKQSYEEKCRQLEEVTTAYRRLYMKTITDGEAAKHFVKTAMIGLELLYPTQNKGGQN